MKSGLIMGALGIVLMGGALAGAAHAESGATSEPGFLEAYRMQSAMETGGLPPVLHADRAPSGGVASGTSDAPLIEVGNVRYRLGLDTGA